MNGSISIAASTDRLSQSARRRMVGVKWEPLFYAEWLGVVFIHFEVAVEVLQRAVPFELDLCEGRAYVSLVAFTMRDMRLRVGGGLGALLFKPISTHGFFNVRTYVRHGNETGIYFLAEWLSNPLSVRLGPPLFGLPYRHGRLYYDHEHERGELRGMVESRDRSTRLEYVSNVDAMGGYRPCEAGSLDEFLLERYTAFTAHRSSRRFFRIWHPPWPQKPISIEMLDLSLMIDAWPWFKTAKVIGANHSPGIRNVWMGRPHSVQYDSL